MLWWSHHLHSRTEGKGLRDSPVKIYPFQYIYIYRKYPLGKGYLKPLSKLTVKEHMDTEIWFLGDTVHWESMNKNTCQTKRSKYRLQPMMLALGFNPVSVYFPRERSLDYHPCPDFSLFFLMFPLHVTITALLDPSQVLLHLAIIIHSVQSTWLHNSHQLRNLVCTGCCYITCTQHTSG